MLNVLFAADFPIEKSGIASTASSILAEYDLGSFQLYSERPICINGVETQRLANKGEVSMGLVFTHTEYSALPTLQKLYPEALYHVGDWPLKHWASVRRVRPFKGSLAALRCFWRLRRISLSTRLAFVTQEDCSSATKFGFGRSVCLPIGVNPPKVGLAQHVDIKSVCISGNFRYPPNRDAALRLLKLAKTQFPEFKVVLVGYYADDFSTEVSNNVEIYPDVPSVVEFLASRRPIYVSLINTGAGAKNKILEAMVAGCPIICTMESLDSSIPVADTIKVVTSDEDVTYQIRKWGLICEQQELTRKSALLADDTRSCRSWCSVAKMTRNLLMPLIS